MRITFYTSQRVWVLEMVGVKSPKTPGLQPQTEQSQNHNPRANPFGVWPNFGKIKKWTGGPGGPSHKPQKTPKKKGGNTYGS